MITLVPIEKEHAEDILAIFNEYVLNGNTTFFDRTVSTRYFDTFIGMSKNLPTVAALDNGRLVGYATLQPYSPFGAFSATAEITFYVKKEETRRGIGKWMSEYLINQAKSNGIDMLLSSVSSLNEGSIHFHHAIGFNQCGIFEKVAEKDGVKFDVIWFQKEI